MQERDDALLQIQQQVEKHRDVASLEEQHAAVIASMRSQLNAAESAAKSEQQLLEDLQQQTQQFERQIATLEASVLGLQQVMVTVLPLLLARVGCSCV